MHCVNFRRFRELRLDLSAAVTILIGPNGSGKSNVLDALLLLREGVRSAPDNALNARGGLRKIITRHQTEHPLRVALVADSAEGTGTVRTVVSTDGSTSTTFRRTIDYNRTANSEMDDDGWFTLPGAADPNYREARRQTATIVHVDAFRNISDRAPLYGGTHVDETGADLAAVLHRHYSNDRDRFFQFEQLMKRVLPQIDIIQSPLLEDGGSTAFSTVSIRFLGDSQTYDLAQLSSGVKDAMVLLTAVHFSEPGSLILLEEPENHLHSGAQRAIMEIIAEAASTDDKQFLITTHSEVLVGMGRTEAVYFVAPAEEPGTSSIRPVADLDEGSLHDNLGIDVSRLLTTLGLQPQVVFIAEGRTDLEATEPIWEHLGIKDRVLAVNAEGGGAETIAAAGASLREGLTRFRLPAKVFILLDSDGNAEEKRSILRRFGFDERNSHVWDGEEIEDYLLLPASLSALASRDRTLVDQAIAAHSHRKGKDRFQTVLRDLGTSSKELSSRLIIRHALASDGSLDAEMMEMAGKVRALAGPLPRIAQSE